MNTNIAILIILILIIGPIPSVSVPAAPINQGLEQNDGTKFTARLWGDERSHGWETIDGYSIVLDEKTKEWKYAVIGIGGKLIPSTKIVGKDAIPGNIQKHLKPSEKVQSKIRGLNASVTPGLPNRVIPYSGTANIPVILINFSDKTIIYTAANFNTLLFGNGVKSMKDYYEEVSYGVFSVSAGPGGVAGWYKASQNHNYYGSNDAEGYDLWPGTLVREAVAAADTSFDFAPYDSNGDCYVDVVDLVHQGSGEEAGGSTTDIWSHSWDLNSAYYYGNSNGGEYTTNDACSSGGFIKINAYVIQPETLLGDQQTMGVFAHEYGHALGLPDLYDTDYSSDGIGIWSLMAGGSWNHIKLEGDTPAQMDAWTKALLGWVTPIVITENNLTQIKQVENNSQVYRLLNGTAEYFLVENRQKVGFDAALPGQGLLIWHIDETRSNNDNDVRRLVDLEEADGNDNPDQVTDPWVSNIIGFTGSSIPNSNLYNGDTSEIIVSNISASASIMTANINPRSLLYVSASTAAITPLTPTNVEFIVTDSTTNGNQINGALVTLTGIATGNNTTDVNGITILTVNATGIGTITATVSKTGYTNGTATITANSLMLNFSVRPQTLNVKTNTSVSFNVTNSTGMPLNNAKVVISGSGVINTDTKYTNSTGIAVFPIYALKAGTISATVSYSTSYASKTAIVILVVPSGNTYGESIPVSTDETVI